MHPDRPLYGTGDLARALGGDETSFTGELLRLIAKADPGNRERLREAFPRQVLAWELWNGTEPPPSEAELLAALDGTHKPATRARVVLWTNGLVATFSPDGEQLVDYQGPWSAALPKVLDDFPDGVTFRISHFGHWLLPVPREHVELIVRQLAVSVDLGAAT